jgi:alanine racemase
MSAAVLTIDLGAITANWRALAGRHAGATAGVVKADAYGLGAARVVPALHGAGCRQFFVAQLDEAMAIRPLAPGCLVAVLNGLAGGRAAEYADHDITPVIGSLGELGVWRATAGAPPRAHRRWRCR